MQNLTERRESGFYAFNVVTIQDANRWFNQAPSLVEYPVSGDATKVASDILPSFTGILWNN